MMKNFLLIGLISVSLVLTNCGDDDVPEKENEEEVIDKVTLTFTPSSGNPLIFTATDPDGEGVEEMAPDAPVSLFTNTDYTLTIKFENTTSGENITDEIELEADEHMIFFSFTTDAFSNPTGNGNVDFRVDPVNYNDKDNNGEPLGLSTSWTTASSPTADGSFRIILKHQPDGIKTSDSESTDGETDVEITWVMNISDPA